MFLRLTVVAIAVAIVAVGAVIFLRGSSATSPLEDLEAFRVQERLEEDAQRLEALALEKPDEQVMAQVVFEELRDVNDVARKLSPRRLEIKGLTGVLTAGGQEHIGHHQVPEDVGQADVPRVYAETQARMLESLVLDLEGRLSCHPLPEPHGLSEPATIVRELSDGEFPCAADDQRPQLEATLTDFKAQMDGVLRVGYPVLAAEVSGRAADMAALLLDPEVSALGLPDDSGRLPSPFALSMPQQDPEGGAVND